MDKPVKSIALENNERFDSAVCCSCFSLSFLMLFHSFHHNNLFAKNICKTTSFSYVSICESVTNPFSTFVVFIIIF